MLGSVCVLGSNHRATIVRQAAAFSLCDAADALGFDAGAAPGGSLLVRAELALSNGSRSVEGARPGRSNVGKQRRSNEIGRVRPLSARCARGRDHPDNVAVRRH
jgi:hypothetical protein